MIKKIKGIKGKKFSISDKRGIFCKYLIKALNQPASIVWLKRGVCGFMTGLVAYRGVVKRELAGAIVICGVEESVTFCLYS